MTWRDLEDWGINMNQDGHYLQKPFITVGAVFEDDIGINDIINDTNDATLDYKGFCYTFKAEIDSDFQVGDYAVVHARDELKIVKIVQVHHTPKIDIHANFEYKWVIQKINFDAFKSRHQEQKRIDELLSALEIAERQKALLDRLNKLANENSAFKELMETVLDADANPTLTVE